MEFVIGIVVVLFAFIIICIVINKCFNKLEKREKVLAKYIVSDREWFDVFGYKDDFIIRKNGNIEFLIKDGIIVASRDLRVTRNFVYYGGNGYGNN
jgi:hypothetical protein